MVCATVQTRADSHSPAICKSLEGRPSPEQPAALAWAVAIASRHAFISLVRCRIASCRENPTVSTTVLGPGRVRDEQWFCALPIVARARA